MIKASPSQLISNGEKNDLAYLGHMHTCNGLEPLLLKKVILSLQPLNVAKQLKTVICHSLKSEFHPMCCLRLTRKISLNLPIFL